MYHIERAKESIKLYIFGEDAGVMCIQRAYIIYKCYTECVAWIGYIKDSPYRDKQIQYICKKYKLEAKEKGLI